MAHLVLQLGPVYHKHLHVEDTPLDVRKAGVGREGLARVVRGGDGVFLVTNNHLRFLGGLSLEILPAMSLQPSSNWDWNSVMRILSL